MLLAQHWEGTMCDFASKIKPGYMMMAGYDVATLGHMASAHRWR